MKSENMIYRPDFVRRVFEAYPDNVDVIVAVMYGKDEELGELLYEIFSDDSWIVDVFHSETLEDARNVARTFSRRQHLHPEWCDEQSEWREFIKEYPLPHSEREIKLWLHTCSEFEDFTDERIDYFTSPTGFQ